MIFPEGVDNSQHVLSRCRALHLHRDLETCACSSGALVKLLGWSMSYEYLNAGIEQETKGDAGPVVNDQDIANIVSQWTGIPIEKVHSSSRSLACTALRCGREGAAAPCDTLWLFRTAYSAIFMTPSAVLCTACARVCKVYTACPSCQCMTDCIEMRPGVERRERAAHQDGGDAAQPGHWAGGGGRRHQPRHPPRARGPQVPQPPDRLLHLLWCASSAFQYSAFQYGASVAHFQHRDALLRPFLRR